MAFANMKFELVGEIAGLSMPLAETKLNEALGAIYDDLIWSFQFKENGWLTPGLQFRTGTQSVGTITVEAGSTEVIGDTAASAAWAAYTGATPFSDYQIRVPYYSLYNITEYDTTSNPPFGTFFLDRPWQDQSGDEQAYMIYQAYFVVPGDSDNDFKRFLEIRDTTNAAPLSYWTLSRRDLSVIDPQRTNFNLPAYVVPYEQDNRPGTQTPGWMLYELWPHPLSILPYTFSYLRRGDMLTLPSDTLPMPLTEELVKWRAREMAYIWKESQKGDGMKRGDGADWQFLAQAARAEYERRFKKISQRDRDLVEAYFTRFVRNPTIWQGDPYATINMGLNVGRM